MKMEPALAARPASCYSRCISEWVNQVAAGLVVIELALDAPPLCSFYITMAATHEVLNQNRRPFVDAIFLRSILHCRKHSRFNAPNGRAPIECAWAVVLGSRSG